MTKNKTSNIIKIIKDNYKIFIPIAFMIVLFASFFFYYKFSLENKFKVDKEEELYQYFDGEKYEYKGIISENRKKEIVDFKEKNIKINQDGTPIYYKNKKTVIFPHDMSIVMPTLSCAEYLTKKYSYIKNNSKDYKLITEGYNNNLGHYFLYDGNDIYFFIDEVKLTVNKEEIKLSPLSYVIATYRDKISYYDKETDTFKTIEIDNDDSTVSSDYYKIYISRDIVDYFGTNVILTNQIKLLSTIDKKG